MRAVEGKPWPPLKREVERGTDLPPILQTPPYGEEMVKSDVTMSARTRRRYTEEFKREAARLARVTQERDILKRAAAFFARDPL